MQGRAGTNGSKPMESAPRTTIPYRNDTLAKQILEAQKKEALRDLQQGDSDDDKPVGRSPVVAPAAGKNSWAANIVDDEKQRAAGSVTSVPLQKASSFGSSGLAPSPASSSARTPQRISSLNSPGTLSPVVSHAMAQHSSSSSVSPPAAGAAGHAPNPPIRKPDYDKTKSMWESGAAKEKRPGEEVRARKWEVKGSGWDVPDEDLRKDTCFEQGDKERRVGKFVNGEWVAGQGNEVVDAFQKARNGFEPKAPSAVDSARAAFEKQASLGSKALPRASSATEGSLVQQARASLKMQGLVAK